MELMITCTDTCGDKPGNVYGLDEYSDDSHICKAAFHSGALLEKGGKFKMIIKPGLFEYKGGLKSTV